VTAGLSVGAAAAAGLDAFKWVWIVFAIAAGICVAVGVLSHFFDLDSRTVISKSYREGSDLRQKVALRTLRKPGDSPQDLENKNRAAAYRWAEKTWRALRRQFPGREQEFLSNIRNAQTKHIFEIYCEQEIQRYGNSLDHFLKAKLELLAAILEKQP